MNKSIIASVVALGMFSGMAQAVDNEVQFHGEVSAATCDLVPSVDGSLNPTGNEIELGDVKINGEGKVVNFAFKPAQTQENIAACDAMAGTANKTLELTWTSDYFGSEGLGIISGGATGSHVKITPVNDKGQNKTFINASKTKHEFDASVLSSQNGEGLKYTARLHAGPDAGEFVSASKFNLTYK